MIESGTRARRSSPDSAGAETAERDPPRPGFGRLTQRLSRLGIGITVYEFDRPIEAVLVSVGDKKLIGTAARLSSGRRAEVLLGMLRRIESEPGCAFLVAYQPGPD